VLADLGDPAAVRSLVKQATDEFGKIDVLVINHSVRPVRPLLEITDEEWREVVALNLDSAFYLCRAVVPGMIERGGGSVVAIGGGGGPAPPVGKAHAVATLTARGALLRGLMREVASAGIRVNWVAPGIIDTVRKHPDWYPEAPDGRVQDLPEVIRQIPLGRPGLPHEIADAVLFVASQEAAYMTGATLNVSGGWGL
jgi:NAD(P)-dependent dehydrogenase (short-subunit alcohol dehydrogenase family)